jgi:hypothetical protein
MRDVARVAILSLATAACGDNLTTPPPAMRGGILAVPGCHYHVRSPDLAEPPAFADLYVGDDPTVRHVHLGLGGDPRTSIAVLWRTNDDDTRAGYVRFGVGGLTGEVPGITYKYLSGIGGVGDAVRVHEAHLCGLTPDTEYTYQIVSDDAHVSPLYTFRTAPDIVATPDAEVTIANLGDSRDGYDVWAQLVDQLQQRAPDLILFSGDAVTIGPVQDEWDEFFEAGEPLLSHVPMLSAHGNHDLHAAAFYAQLAMPGNETSFSLDYGHAHITVLDTSPPELGDLSGELRDFLARDLDAHDDATWKIVNHHYGVYSSSMHGSDPTIQEEWMPLYDQHHVDLVLTGHDHDYERSVPMKGGVPVATPQEGTVYMVSGGAGAVLYANSSSVWTALSASTYSALTLRIRKTMLVLDAFDPSGAPLDTLTITKP